MQPKLGARTHPKSPIREGELDVVRMLSPQSVTAARKSTSQHCISVF